MTYGEKDFVEKWSKQRQQQKWKSYFYGVLIMAFCLFITQGFFAVAGEEHMFQNLRGIKILIVASIIGGLLLGFIQRWAMEKTYQNDSAIMSAEQKKKAEDNIIQNKRRFQFEQQSLREDLQAKQRELLQEVQVSIRTVIQAFGESQGYDFIFTDASIAYAAEELRL